MEELSRSMAFRGFCAVLRKPLRPSPREHEGLPDACARGQAEAAAERRAWPGIRIAGTRVDGNPPVLFRISGGVQRRGLPEGRLYPAHAADDALRSEQYPEP